MEHISGCGPCTCMLTYLKLLPDTLEVCIQGHAQLIQFGLVNVYIRGQALSPLPQLLSGWAGSVSAGVLYCLITENSATVLPALQTEPSPAGPPCHFEGPALSSIFVSCPLCDTLGRWRVKWCLQKSVHKLKPCPFTFVVPFW
jgi:hypothetical protein